MKKVIGLVCVFLLLLSFTGCGESEEVTTGSDTTDRVQTEEKGSLEIVKNAFKNFERPHSFAMEQEAQVFEDGVKIGDDENLQLNKNEKVKTMIYVDGGNLRGETNILDDTYVQIINEEEKAEYRYFEGKKTGKKKELKDEDLLGVNSMEYDVNDEKIWTGLKTAKMDTFLDEEIVYMELVGKSEDGSQVTSKIWYSTKYGVALKTEAYNEKDDLFFMNQVVKIIEGGEYSEKMVPPADMKWN